MHPWVQVFNGHFVTCVSQMFAKQEQRCHHVHVTKMCEHLTGISAGLRCNTSSQRDICRHTALHFPIPSPMLPLCVHVWIYQLCLVEWWVSDMVPNWVRLALNGTNPWIFQIRFQSIWLTEPKCTEIWS